jgi:hypothetical protein
LFHFRDCQPAFVCYSLVYLDLNLYGIPHSGYSSPRSDGRSPLLVVQPQNTLP